MTEEQFWIKRAMQPNDEGFVVYSWLESYAKSREGQARDLNRNGAAKSSWWNEHAAFVEALVRQDNVTVEIAADRDDPTTIWGFAATSGDVIHYALVKRALTKSDEAMARVVLGDLLGDRLTKPCAYTSEQRDLYRLGMVPRDWYPSASWMALNYRRNAA